MLKPLFNQRIGAGMLQHLGRSTKSSSRTQQFLQEQIRQLSNRSTAGKPSISIVGYQRAVSRPSSRFKHGQFSLYATESSSGSNSDKKLEEKLANRTLKADPENVSTTSSVREVFEEDPPTTQKDPNMVGGIKSDLNMVKETFALREVPREVLIFGAAGLVPYVTTTASTLFLAWDISNVQSVGRSYIFTEHTAQMLLGTLEPIQIGFGAIILSFLGAIHWGLEFAGYGGHAPYRRYSLGILAPALAWPTIFMPIDYALLTQFLGFTAMYFADAQVTNKGWAPKWYSTYRFMLTFIVGACIVGTLAGRGQMGDAMAPHLPAPAKRAGGEAIDKKDRHNQVMKHESKDVQILPDDKKEEDDSEEKSDDGSKDKKKNEKEDKDDKNSKDKKDGDKAKKEDDDKSKDGDSKDKSKKDSKDKKSKEDSSKKDDSSDEEDDSDSDSEDSGDDKKDKSKGKEKGSSGDKSKKDSKDSGKSDTADKDNADKPKEKNADKKDQSKGDDKAQKEKSDEGKKDKGKSGDDEGSSEDDSDDGADKGDDDKGSDDAKGGEDKKKDKKGDDSKGKKK